MSAAPFVVFGVVASALVVATVLATTLGGRTELYAPLAFPPVPVTRLRPLCGCVTPAGLATDERLRSNALFQGAMPDPRGLTALAAYWGEFIRDDVLREVPGEPYAVTLVPGTAIMNLTRDVVSGPCQAVNAHSPWIDGSALYGDNVTARNVRDGLGCRLLAGAGSELHALWRSEHNRLCGVLEARQPLWTDTERFWKARQLVVATIQHITYEHWLPALFGSQAGLVGQTWTAHSFADGGISTEFAVAAFVDSMLPAPVNLSAAYSTAAQQVDQRVVDALRAQDVVVRALFRGRDLGVASYSSVRACFVGAGPADEPEAYAGLLGEPLVPGSSLPLTLAYVLAEQFTRLRAWDPYFYTRINVGQPYHNELRASTLGSVIRANTPFAAPADVFRLSKR